MKRFSLAIALAFLLSGGSLRAEEPKVSVSGYVLTDFVYYVNEEGQYSEQLVSGDYALAANEGYNAFEITRGYLTFSAQLTDKVLASITTDLRTDSDGYRRIFAKFAFVEFRDLAPHTKIRFGLQEPPWAFSDAELWRYRMVEQGFYSYWGTFSTADFGVSLLGDVLDGLFKYHFAILNGEGVSGIETERFKEYVARFTFDLGSADKIRFYPSAGYSSNHHGEQGLRDEVFMTGAGLDLLGRVHLAGEYFQGIYGMEAGELPLVRGVWPAGALDMIEFADPALLLVDEKDVNFAGWAAYADIKLLDKLNLFGRYDLYDPNTDPDFDRDGETLWTAGIAYHPIDNLWVTLDYREFSFQEPDPDHDNDKELPSTRAVYTHWKIAY